MDADKRKKSLFVGLGLIIVGVIILLERIGFHSDFIDHYLYRWESAMILIGLLLIFVRRNYFGGLVTLGIGSYFLIDELYFIPSNWEIWFFPVLLILGGIAHILEPHKRVCNK